MNLDLGNRTALVTGSTAGIGSAIAQALAHEGAHVIVNGRSQGRVDAALAKIRESKLQGRVEGIAADLATNAGCDSVVQRFPGLKAGEQPDTTRRNWWA